MNDLVNSAVLFKTPPIPTPWPSKLWVKHHVTKMLTMISKQTVPRLSSAETTLVLE